jgi:4-diphosphocytidyl-2-C-methyl-D-erythritol kinase
MSSCVVAAFSKINLALYVLKKRNDGYHDIATLMQAIDLHDSIRFTITDSDLRMTCSDPALTTGEDNLVVKAIRMMEDRSARALPMQIHLEKRIPIGAGLGGGSSDAAAALWATNSLFQLEWSPEILMELAAGLGSDVPFFLSAGQALAEGRGERLTPVTWPLEYHILVVFPGVFVSAREGYATAKISLTNPLAQHKIRRSLGPEKFWDWVSSQTNDLTDGVVSSHPEVATCLTAVRNFGALYAGMNGSGSSVFGLFSDPLSDSDVQSLAAEHGWQVFRARPLRSKEGVLPTLVKGT